MQQYGDMNAISTKQGVHVCVARPNIHTAQLSITVHTLWTGHGRPRYLPCNKSRNLCCCQHRTLHARARTHTPHTHTHTHTHTYTDTHTHTHTYTDTHIHIHTHHTHTHTHTYTYTHIHTHPHIHRHTHTHTPTRRLGALRTFVTCRKPLQPDTHSYKTSQHSGDVIWTAKQQT
jgi:hypothetical protein